MGRTWSTFNAPPQWGKLQGIPSDLADGEITWDEIQNKPFSNNNPLFNNGNRGISIADSDIYGNVGIQFNRGKASFLQAALLYLDWAWSQDADFDVRVGVDDGRFCIYLVNDFKLFLYGLPTSPNGLPSACIWRDSNGYLRIV